MHRGGHGALLDRGAAHGLFASDPANYLDRLSHFAARGHVRSYTVNADIALVAQVRLERFPSGGRDGFPSQASALPMTPSAVAFIRTNGLMRGLMNR